MSERTWEDGEKWYAECYEIRRTRNEMWSASDESGTKFEQVRADRCDLFRSDFRDGAISAWIVNAANDYSVIGSDARRAGWSAAVEWMKANPEKPKVRRWRVERNERGAEFRYTLDGVTRYCSDHCLAVEFESIDKPEPVFNCTVKEVTDDN